MPLTVRTSARRRRKTPDEKRPGESTSAAQVMAPTRMKLRVRRRDNAAAGAAAGGGQPEEEEERSRENSGRSSRRKTTTSTTAAATSSSSSPPPSSSSASASARAVMAAEEASPDSKCPICLDRFNNLAYLDRCLHRFCFPCIQEWSHNKAECPLCKQPFASILHSVRAEDDFKEYTLRPAPANSSVAATVAMVAAMASAARSDHQMRLMLRRHRGPDGGETNTRRRRRERGGRGRRSGVWEWYLDSPPLALPPLPHHPAVSPVVAEDSEEGEDLEEQRIRGGADLAERGVIFEGLTGLGGAVAPVGPNDRASRRLMTRLVARQRLQREGGTVRRLRERETVAFRRALYRSGIRVRGVAGINGNGNQGQQQQRDITAESFRRNPTHLNRLRPWLRRELTVLYGAHGSLVDIVQRIIMARLARHGLEDTPTVEEELRPFLLARTDHFLHELVSFARSPLSLENYDLQAVYEPPAAALELDGTSSSSESSSVIAISEGEEEERQVGGRSEERQLVRAGGAHDDVIQAGSCLSLSAWDDETPGPSYSTAEPSCSLASLSFSPAPQEAANEEEAGEKRDEEEECLIVGYKKPIAERTPELVQLSSDTEEEEEKKKEEENAAEKPPSLPSTTPPLSYLPTIPPSTSGACSREQDDQPKEKDGEHRSHARSWSGSSGRNSVCTLSPVTPGESELRRESWRDRKSCSEVTREKRRKKKRRRRGRDRSGDRLRKSGTLYNPNRSIYPALMRHCSPSPFHSSVESGSPLPPSPDDSSWEYPCSQVSPLTSSVSSPSRSFSSSPLCSSPQPSSPTAQTPSLSPSNNHHGEKPGGKRKYKSRHLDSDDKDPTWRPSSSHCREKRRERGVKERRKKGRDGGRRRERQRRDVGESSSRRSREDRSPSVEIIYEGTITSSMTQSPARKRRRKRHRNTQHSSSPVIITLDSDSSHDDANNKNNHSSSSSPLSSQQTVDFSDLPPLPLVHSAGVGGALNAEIGELPVDILDRGSDGSETEPADQPEAAGPIAIDNSDHDVDVENVEESGSLLGLDEDKGQMRTADTKLTAPGNQTGVGGVEGGSQPTGAIDAAATSTNLVRKRDAEVSTSDSHLLATILNDLKGITAPKCDLSLNFEPSCSPETRNKRFRKQCEVSQSRSNQDDWLAETRYPYTDSSDKRLSYDLVDENRGSDLPTCRTSIRPLPPLEQPKECRVREEGKDAPPLLKRASPVRSYNRNTPPPLKHKDHGSPHLSPISPIDLHSPCTSVGTDPVGVNSHVDLNSNPTVSSVDSCLGAELPKDNPAIPGISALNQHVTNTMAQRGEPASTSSILADDMHSSCHLALIDSHSTAPSKRGASAASIHSMSHKHPIDFHSSSGLENSSTSADCISHLGFSSFHSSKVHSGRDSTKEISSSGHRSSPIDLQPVNSLSPIDFHLAKTGWFREKPAHTDSTSRSNTMSSNSSRVAPVDPHPSSSVSAEGTPGGGDVFSGVNFNDTSPPVFVSSIDSRTQNLCSPIDSHLSTLREDFSERRLPCRVSSVPTTATSGRLSPIGVHPNSPKFRVDLHSSTAASERLMDSKATSIVNHGVRSPHGHLPPIDLHHTNPVPPGNAHSSVSVRAMMDEHLNHTALSSTTFHTSHKKCSSQSQPTVESHSKLLNLTDSHSKPRNHFDSRSNPQISIDACPKHNLPIDSHPKNSQRDFQLPTEYVITSSHQSVDNQWNSDASIDTHSDSKSPIDERSASSVWNTHTHSAT